MYSLYYWYPLEGLQKDYTVVSDFTNNLSKFTWYLFLFKPITSVRELKVHTIKPEVLGLSQTPQLTSKCLLIGKIHQEKALTCRQFEIDNMIELYLQLAYCRSALMVGDQLTLENVNLNVQVETFR